MLHLIPIMTTGQVHVVPGTMWLQFVDRVYKTGKRISIYFRYLKCVLVTLALQIHITVPLLCCPFYHDITYDTAMPVTECKWDFSLTTDTPYLALMGQLSGVYCEDLGKTDCVIKAPHISKCSDLAYCCVQCVSPFHLVPVILPYWSLPNGQHAGRRCR